MTRSTRASTGLVMTCSTSGTTTPVALMVASTGPRSTIAVRMASRRRLGETQARQPEVARRRPARAPVPPTASAAAGLAARDVGVDRAVHVPGVSRKPGARPARDFRPVSQRGRRAGVRGRTTAVRKWTARTARRSRHQHCISTATGMRLHLHASARLVRSHARRQRPRSHRAHARAAGRSRTAQGGHARPEGTEGRARRVGAEVGGREGASRSRSFRRVKKGGLRRRRAVRPRRAQREVGQERHVVVAGVPDAHRRQPRRCRSAARRWTCVLVVIDQRGLEQLLKNQFKLGARRVGGRRARWVATRKRRPTSRCARRSSATRARAACLPA